MRIRRELGVLVVFVSFSSIAAIAAMGEETFPESRFGQPPARANFGIDSGYAHREAVKMDVDAARTVERKLASAPAATEKSEARLKGIQEIALVASDLGYFPKTVFITRDIPVRLYVTGASKNTLCIMMDDFKVRKQVQAMKIEEINFTASVPGKYRFYCPVNGMEGTMIVKELASGPTN